MIAPVLVTGGAGFVGSHVVTQLLAQGARVVVFDNFSFGKASNLPRHEQLSVIQGDLRDRGAVEALVTSTRPAAVVHLAALHYIPYCDRNPVETVEVNVAGTRNLLSCLRSHLPERVFFASTAAVYKPGTTPHREPDIPGPTDIYGQTKLAGEELVELFHARTGVPTIIGRLFNVIGPNETNPHLVPEIVKELRAGVRRLRLGNLTTKRDYVHASDVAFAISALLDMRPVGSDTFNIGTGEQHEGASLIRAFEEILEERIEIEVDPARVRRSDRPELCADNSKLRAATGWHPKVGLKDALRDLIEAP